MIHNRAQENERIQDTNQVLKWEKSGMNTEFLEEEWKP